MSHASGESKVPQSIQEKAPKGLEESLPDSVHPTKGSAGRGVSHAKDGGAASIVPQKIQEALPEKIERMVPNAIHDTGDKAGLHQGRMRQPQPRRLCSEEPRLTVSQK